MGSTIEGRVKYVTETPEIDGPIQNRNIQRERRDTEKDRHKVFYFFNFVFQDKVSQHKVF